MFARCFKAAVMAGAALVVIPMAARAQTADPFDTGRISRPGIEINRHERVGVYRIAEPRASRPPAPDKQAKPSLVTRVLHRDIRYGDWVGAQIFVFICGLLGAMIALALAPRTTTLALAAIDAEPARAAVVGFLGLAALGVINALNGALFGTIIWIPFGTMVALTSTVTILFSGLLGVAYFGGVMQKRRRRGVRGFFSRAALGLIAIALFNCIPGVNAASLFLQLIAFVLGLGGLIITGFGREPDWLSKRLNASARDWRD